MASHEEIGHVANVPQPVDLPIIDLSKLHNMSSRSLLVEEIGKASLKLGCFEVINHGIHKSIIEGALEVALNFFELPKEEKLNLISDDIKKPVRYSDFNNSKAFLKQYANPLNEWIKMWPLSPPGYREKMGRYASEVRKLALQLMDAILESLGLGRAYLREKLEEGMQFMAINDYLRSSKIIDSMAMAPHTDYGFITILHQNCGGLQILERNTGNWIEVPKIPETLHIHIGDFLEVLSNGRYKAVVHRAVHNSQYRRISIASIHGLPMDLKVTTAKELVDEQNPRIYKDSSFLDFLDFLSYAKSSGKMTFLETLRILNP
ncbi:Hyoscyamine 6-dioxygenase [Apostasia shenzhenica]|uniref:Hyoscyamine 6-dioxygenase n=1 Tax=Apostasia shenzhenica TaxID=1088818 RepID=A0A2I0ATP6_9ASPA|nr:Hyoscyamine 6-dioxygenase [Apostasia shenzhenica]